MKVWLVNPFDPLPGEQEQLGRYGHLALALRDAGHEVEAVLAPAAVAAGRVGLRADVAGAEKVIDDKFIEDRCDCAHDRFCPGTYLLVVHEGHWRYHTGHVVAAGAMAGLAVFLQDGEDIFGECHGRGHSRHARQDGGEHYRGGFLRCLHVGSPKSVYEHFLCLYARHKEAFD